MNFLYLVVLRRTPSNLLTRFVNLAQSVVAVPIEPAERLHRVRAHRLNDAERVAVMRSYQAGESMAALASRYQVTRATISKLLRDAGISLHAQRRISDSEIDEAVRLYESGWSLERIGAHLHFDHKTIYRHLLKRGKSMRGPNDWQLRR